MRTKNICKFVSGSEPDKLETLCFIFESNPAIMEKEVILAQNRVFLIKQGTGDFFCGGNKVSFSPGCLIFAFEGEQVSVSAQDTSCQYMYIDFNGIRGGNLLSRFSIHRQNRMFTGFDGLVPFWHDSLTRASEENIDLAAESMLLYAFSRLSGTSSAQNDLIKQITEITEQDFTNHELSMSLIADELSYNAKYLSHIFKEKMGIGYTEYLRNVRLKYAVSLLDFGIDSVKNVAFLSGFSDPLYFSTVFKNSLGMSPREYQKRNKVGQD